MNPKNLSCPVFQPKVTSLSWSCPVFPTGRKFFFSFFVRFLFSFFVRFFSSFCLRIIFDRGQKNWSVNIDMFARLTVCIEKMRSKKGLKITIKSLIMHYMQYKKFWAFYKGRLIRWWIIYFPINYHMITWNFGPALIICPTNYWSLNKGPAWAGYRKSFGIWVPLGYRLNFNSWRPCPEPLYLEEPVSGSLAQEYFFFFKDGNSNW